MQMRQTLRQTVGNRLHRPIFVVVVVLRFEGVRQRILLRPPVTAKTPM